MDYCYIKKDGLWWGVFLKHSLIHPTYGSLEKDRKLHLRGSYQLAKESFIELNQSFHFGGYKKVETPKIHIPPQFYEITV